MESLEVQKIQCEMKTDLNLLLECLKYQMDSPTSQKEALVTIYSICQQNSDASNYLREIGGLTFITDLVKSSVHCMVKEAALFTLGVIIENNVYCQQNMCASGLFEDLVLFLMNKDSSVNLKRMSVYVVLVLVSNNKSGQTHVRETGCIGVLLQLFRTALSISEINLSDENINQYYQLWSSVCSTLCACVNNPQNEENQKICSSLFPHTKQWLDRCIEPEIVRPICSFVGLTVANNSHVQKYFVSIGGLDILAKVLVKLVDDSFRNYASTKLAVVVTKTLDACIADNSAIGAVLSKYHIVPKLLRLLTYDTLDSGEKLSLILAIGHCTEVCEENQYDLLKNSGLPLMIQVLTEPQDEELSKAAMFVLQNCKQMTEKLSLKISEDSLHTNNTEDLEMNLQTRERNLEDYWKKAKEILHRLNLLENEHYEDTCRSFHTRETEHSNQKQDLVKAVEHVQHKETTWKKNVCQKFCNQRDRNGDENPKLCQTDKTRKQCCEISPESCKEIWRHVDLTVIESDAGIHTHSPLMDRTRRKIFVDVLPEANMPTASKYHDVDASDQKSHVDGLCKKMQCPQMNCQLHDLVSTTAVNDKSRKNGILKAVNPVNASMGQSEQNNTLYSVDKLQRGSVLSDLHGHERTACEREQSLLETSDHLFKQPALTLNTQQAQIAGGNKEISIQTTSASPKKSDLRCMGCVKVGLSLNSKNFSKMLQTCPYQCDRHRVILEAEERYKEKLKKLAFCNNSSSTPYQKIVLTPIKKGSLNTESSTFRSRISQESLQSILLTPMKKAKTGRSNGNVKLNKNIQLPEKYDLIATCPKILQTDQDNNLKSQKIKEVHQTDHESLNGKRVYSFDEDESNESPSLAMHTGTLQKRQRRPRKDFTTEEINYLLNGVKNMGNHWNLILWSYPFQKGRTNVDLAKKYHRLHMHVIEI
ncbi:PREDICTED: telomere repeats-binding bouquet formation protein 1 isoform X2 [Gavialis gangeticus]|uniref:telomere repeats-binding bouquet formation protein 1 isoform X2 n=1 Tax=Gavialis gangeticus TaxID=94835 RepID=UPI00092E7972|nr:PREDICTED: telomere repeats-binding bouquet formation protein 1 isoform X2 [Gavialis gangeticus]